jgi:DNA-binding transcriptional ArsR family regulator
MSICDPELQSVASRYRVPANDLRSPALTERIRAMANPKINVDTLFHALGDPKRRAILDRLCHGPVSVSNLATPLGVTVTAVMQHLQILEDCGLVHTEKLGRVRTCRIDTAGFTALQQWIDDHRTLFEQRLDRLGELLELDDEE